MLLDPTPSSALAAPTRCGRVRRGANEGGSVILLVLVILFFASLALSRFIEKAGVELLTEVRSADQGRLRADAYSALEVTLAALADFIAVDRGLYNQGQGWDKPLEYAEYTPRNGTTVEVTFEDESGKISLPRMDQPTMQVMFESFGLLQRDAERVTDALLVWMRANHTAASYDTDPQIYERADPPYKPPQRSLRTFQELAAIEVARDFFYDKDGLPTDLWRQFADAVSLYNFDSANLNAARPATLTIAGFDSSQTGIIADYLGGKGTRAPGTPPYFRSLNEARALLGANAPGSSLGIQVRCLRINVTVQEGVASFRVSAVVAPPGGATAVGPVAAPQSTNTTATTNTVTAANTAAPNTTNASTSAATTAKSLNYPFRVLEIQEDADKPLPPPEPAAQ
jgi:general secretion pathway protein K